MSERELSQQPEKHCLICKGTGHTYMECPKVPFMSLVLGAIGVPDLLGPPREHVANELMSIEQLKVKPEVES